MKTTEIKKIKNEIIALFARNNKTIIGIKHLTLSNSDLNVKLPYKSVTITSVFIRNNHVCFNFVANKGQIMYEATLSDTEVKAYKEVLKRLKDTLK